MRQLCAQQTPCIISPDGIVPGAVVKAVSNRLSLPFLSSPYPADFLESRLLGFLREKIEKRIAVCGVFLTFRGKGILIRGDSGTGKSSSALELILRGGQLISDDIVELSRTAEDTVVGACPDAIRNLMDMKGRGIVNLKDTLGCRAIANESRVDLVISLTKDPTDEAKCRAVFRMLGVEIPMVCLSAGKRPSDIAMRIVETIMHRYPDTLQQQPYDDKLLPHSTYTLESVRVL
jgi:serine kinase of HPr protein (carbohydrate metabolism regulator)